MFPGRNDEKKRELGEGLARTVAQILNVPEAYISVSIVDIPEKEWDKNVYDIFMKDKTHLYKEPDYGEE